MFDIFGLEISTRLIFQILVSLAFLGGIILMISGEAFQTLHRAFQKEFGLRKRLIPKIENTSFDIVDRILMKNRFAAGLIITVVSFVLLLVNK